MNNCFKDVKKLVLESEGNKYFERNKSLFEDESYVSEAMKFYNNFIAETNVRGGTGGRLLQRL